MKLTRRNAEESGEQPEKAAKAPKAPKQPKQPKGQKAPKAPKQKSGKGSGKSKKGGSGRFVMLIGDDGAILVYMQGATVVRRLFAPSPQPDHTASIVELMRTNPKVPLYILADVLDQQYVRHSFPPVSSMSVGGLVRRRLDRDFQAEDLKGSLPLGRDKGGRKEWNFLLIALANTPMMQQWIEVMVELPNELKGIYLLPVESQHYIPALKKEIGGDVLPWQLLVTHNKVSGFRQVVLKDGKLVFTRVSQAIDDSTAAVIAGNIEQEILNSIEYLRRLGFQDNPTLEITVIAAQEVKEVLDMNRFLAGQAQVLTPMEVADLLGLQQAALSADRFGDVVVATWFGRAKKRTLKLQTAYGESLSKLYLARRGLMAVGALALVGCLGMGAMNLIAMLGNNKEAATIEASQAPLKAQLAEQEKLLGALDKSVAFKAAVVAMSNAYMKDMHNPLDFLSQLAPLMNEEVRVSKLEWVPVVVNPNAQTPPPIPGEKQTMTGPLEIKMTIEFLKKYNDVESLTRAVDDFVATMEKGLPRYDLTVEPYSWISTSAGLEISLDQQPASQAITDDKINSIEVTVHGPSPAPEGAQPGSVAP